MEGKGAAVGRGVIVDHEAAVVCAASATPGSPAARSTFVCLLYRRSNEQVRTRELIRMPVHLLQRACFLSASQ